MEICLKNITKAYEGTGEKALAIADVSVRIARGEFFFLLGPSGCGKTTLLRIIAGLLQPTSGQIFFDEKDVTNLPAEKRNTAMVFQGYALWPHMTVRRNVEFGLKMRRIGRKERIRCTNEQLDRVQMNDYGFRKPNQLSGGQQQRVALARALAAGSDCLLLDEPLSNLDARLRSHMRGELRSLIKSSGITAVYVTHDQKEALSMADRIAVMNEGRIVQIDTPEQIYNRPFNQYVADFLGEANFIKGKLVETGIRARIKTCLGIITSSCVQDIEAGSDVACCIRPERITMLPADYSAGSLDVSVLPAKVLSKIYLGEIRQYVCALGDSDQGHIQWKISAMADSYESVMEGDQVCLGLAANHVAVLNSV
jgi:iron(III) transport system ATP-binding protein